MIGAPDGPAVVIGVGNVLRRDDGVGVRLVEELRCVTAREPGALPGATRLVDGGTLGLDLLAHVEGARSLLFLDAVDLGQPAGTVSVLHGDAIEATVDTWGRTLPGGVGELLAMARLAGCLPRRVALVGVQAADTTDGLGLSACVEAAVPSAVAAACQALLDLDGLAAGPILRPSRPGTATEGATA